MATRKQKKETNQPANSTEVNPLASAPSAMLAASSTPSSVETAGGNMIMKAITDMRDEFSANFTGVLTAIQGIKHDFNEFSNRLAEAEQRIGDTEDNVTTLQKSVADLQKQVLSLSAKTEDQENRSRRNNLRLINLPEGAEGRVAAAFLESWLPEVFGADSFPYPVFVERAHRLQGRQDRNIPRALIMRFLNFKDKERVIRAARAKGKVMFKEQEVKFFQDVSRETHIKRKRFDEVKQQLKALNVQYGILHPARLRVTHAGRSQIFDTPEDAAAFVRGLSDGRGEASSSPG